MFLFKKAKHASKSNFKSASVRSFVVVSTVVLSLVFATAAFGVQALSSISSIFALTAVDKSDSQLTDSTPPNQEAALVGNALSENGSAADNDITELSPMSFSRQGDAVATIGNVGYPTLKEAFAAAPAGVETAVTLQKDIKMQDGLDDDGNLNDIAVVNYNQIINFNMNGKSITVGPEFKDRPIKNLGILTVYGNGTIDSSASVWKGYGAIRNEGTGKLTIKDGTYKGSLYANGSAIRNGVYSTVTIEGGAYFAVTALYNLGTATITAGIFSSNYCNHCEGEEYTSYVINSLKNSTLTIDPKNNNDVKVYGTAGVSIFEAACVTINGGIFYSEECKNDRNHETHYALYVSGVADQVAKCTINGGYFYSDGGNSTIFIQNDSPVDNGGTPGASVVKINGGTFERKFEISLFNFSGINSSVLAINNGAFKNVTEADESLIRSNAENGGAQCVAKSGNNITVTKKHSTKVLSTTASSHTIGCANGCSYEAVESSHTFTHANISAPTESSAGSQGDVCTACNYHKTVIDLNKPNVTTMAIDSAQNMHAENATSSVVDNINTTEAISNETRTNVRNAQSCGKTISSEILFEPVEKDLANATDASSIDEAISKEYIVAEHGQITIVQYLNIAINLKDSDGVHLGTIDSLDEPMTFRCAVPQAMRGGSNRKFHIVRVHNGEASILPVTKLSNGLLEFKSDKFSTYALGYVDAPMTSGGGGSIGGGSGNSGAGNTGATGGVSPDASAKNPSIENNLSGGASSSNSVKTSPLTGADGERIFAADVLGLEFAETSVVADSLKLEAPASGEDQNSCIAVTYFVAALLILTAAVVIYRRRKIAP